jgi:hypothetical protein
MESLPIIPYLNSYIRDPTNSASSNIAGTVRRKVIESIIGKINIHPIITPTN